MAVERSRHPVMELVRDQAGGRDLAEPSFHRAQPQVADLLLFVRAVSDPTVVFEAEHEEAVIVGGDRHAVDASRACWTGAWLDGERQVRLHGQLRNRSGVLAVEVADVRPAELVDHVTKFAGAPGPRAPCVDASADVVEVNDIGCAEPGQVGVRSLQLVGPRAHDLGLESLNGWQGHGGRRVHAAFGFFLLGSPISWRAAVPMCASRRASGWVGSVFSSSRVSIAKPRIRRSAPIRPLVREWSASAYGLRSGGPSMSRICRANASTKRPQEEREPSEA